MVTTRVTVKFQARYQPQDLLFEICCDKSGDAKSLSRGTFIFHWSNRQGDGQRARKNKNRTLLQELTVSCLVKEYSSLPYVRRVSSSHHTDMKPFLDPINPETPLYWD
jgi:hypothetical protein